MKYELENGSSIETIDNPGKVTRGKRALMKPIDDFKGEFELDTDIHDKQKLSVEQIKNMHNQNILIKESFDCGGFFDNGEYIKIDTFTYKDGAWDGLNYFLYRYDLYGKLWIAYQ